MRTLPCLVLLAGLGGLSCESSKAVPPPPNPELKPPAVDLRLSGANAFGYTNLLVPLRDIAVKTSDGRVLDVERARNLVDLAHPEQNSIIGRVVVPPDAAGVTLTIRLDDWGGYEGANGSGLLDLRGPPIVVEADRTLFTGRSKAVVTIDVARSLVDRARGGHALVPMTEVHF